MAVLGTMLGPQLSNDKDEPLQLKRKRICQVAMMTAL